MDTLCDWTDAILFMCAHFSELYKEGVPHSGSDQLQITRGSPDSWFKHHQSHDFCSFEASSDAVTVTASEYLNRPQKLSGLFFLLLTLTS